MSRGSLGALGLLGLALAGCGDPAPEVCRDPGAGVTCKNLSSYGIFTGPLRDLRPAASVVPFAPNTPLFSDYTTKHRVVYVPPGQTVRYDETLPLVFPLGSIIAKTFSYPDDLRDPARGGRILETRLLVNGPDGWDARPFIWNEEQTEATLEPLGTTVDAAWTQADGTRRTNNYVVPNTNMCKECHQDAKKVMNLIGITARQLNGDYAYEGGRENQLARWTRTGVLTGAPPPEQAPRLAQWDNERDFTVAQRARAWLEANCAHCHNEAGSARPSGLELSASELVPYEYGVCKSPVAAGKGAGDRLYGITPGDPDASILVYRIESVEPKVMMPETGRRLAHKEGIALVRQWIRELPGSCK